MLLVPMLGLFVTFALGCRHPVFLQMISDTSAPCSWQTQTCGPCPGLNVTIDGALLTIEGVLPAANYERCLRQVTWISLAFGGEEGLGERSVVFSVISTAGDTATATKTIDVVVRNDTACGDLRTCCEALFAFTTCALRQHSV